MEKRASNFKDIAGQRFGKLVAIALIGFKQNHARWRCRCDCGNETIVNGNSLRRGRTISCGCFALESKRLSRGESGFNRLLMYYKIGAKKRNLTFELSLDQFKALTSQPYHFCGVPPIQSARAINKGRTTKEGAEYSEYLYNGVDRKDNKIGYTLANSIPCCKVCNRGKSSMSYEEFMGYIERIRYGRK